MEVSCSSRSHQVELCTMPIFASSWFHSQPHLTRLQQLENARTVFYESFLLKLLREALLEKFYEEKSSKLYESLMWEFLSHVATFADHQAYKTIS